MSTILGLSFFPAFLPASSGGEIRLFHIYRELSRHFRVILLTSGQFGGKVEILDHGPTFTEVRVPKGAEFEDSWKVLCEEAGSGDLSGPCLAHSAAEFGELHRQYLKYYQVSDIIIHDSPFLVYHDLFLGLDNKPRVYNSYNVEFDLYREMHKDAKSQVVVDIVKAAETKLCSLSDKIYVCSVEDGRRFAELYPESVEYSLLLNGVEPFLATEWRGERSQRIVFMGSGHLPNVHAARFIVNEVAPHYEELHFDIIGSCLPPGEYGVNVTAYGRVSAAQKSELLFGARCAINPMRGGGGSSLKIADFAAHAVPLVSTKLGVRGFEYQAGKHYIEFDTDTPRSALDEALSDYGLLNSISTAAAFHISSRFTWDVIVDVLSKDIIELLGNVPNTPLYVVLNDYNAFNSIGGGATRIKDLYKAVCESARVVFLCFSESERFSRSDFEDGRLAVIEVPRTAAHIRANDEMASQFYISVVDILASKFAIENPTFVDIYAGARQAAKLVICEHPYMVTLPKNFGDSFVYSSQNCEFALKRQMLVDHPSRDNLLEVLARTESYAVACSSLVVTVSDEDAQAFGELYSITAPIVTVANGASEPAKFEAKRYTTIAQKVGRRSAVFLGSGHVPNIEAARFIVTQLAPALQDITFHIVGSACSSLDSIGSPNVVLWGVLNEQDKAAMLSYCSIALNPMLSGSGSNVKIADYLKNGLHVLSTPFGARGYREQIVMDISISEIDKFAERLRDLMNTQEVLESARISRAARYVGELSMVANGRSYARLLEGISSSRRKVLYVTYRYNFPRRGGAEIYVNRLIEGLADDGWQVDVVSPRVVEIRDSNRFASDYFDAPGMGAIPVGNPRIRCARFPVDKSEPDKADLAEIWKCQPTYERHLFGSLDVEPQSSGLAWGWGEREGGGRWAYREFGIFCSIDGRLKLHGLSIAEQYMQICKASGEMHWEGVVNEHFDVDIFVKRGWLSVHVFYMNELEVDDVRPLGVYVLSLAINGADLLATRIDVSSLIGGDATVVYRRYYDAYCRSRLLRDVCLTDLRGPHSSELDAYLEENMCNYDLVITHNVVFSTATKSVSLARAKGVPSILIPHAHLDDDYYHFRDLYDAYENTDRLLVSPRAACKFFESIGLENVYDHAPGIDTDECFSSEELACFREIYPNKDPFFLILGRKAGAKGYSDVIDAVLTLPEQERPRIVMIGPDDDKVSIHSECVTYLGLQDRKVVRGALMACVALISMSQSESFGIVLLEAGLAGTPVLANRGCAAFGDLVEDGRNGYLVDKEALPSLMRRLLGDPDHCRILGKSGREMAMSHDWKKVVANFIEIVNDLVDQKVSEV